MTGSRGSKLIAACTCAGSAAVLLANVSPALGLGNGPPARAKAPVGFSLSRTQALISVQFSNGSLVTVGGTAVPASARRSRGTVRGGSTAKCSVNFTRSANSSHGKTSVRWFGGIGCARQQVLFGQAYLQESATKIDGTGQHYQGTLRSASSGRDVTLVNASRPSLYVRHLTNVYFPAGTKSGRISVYPARGQILNGASRCTVVRIAKYGLGVHCDLYSNRF